MTSRTDEDAFAASILSPSSHPTQQFHPSSPPSSSSSSSRQPNISNNPGDVALNRRLRNGLKCPTCSKGILCEMHRLCDGDDQVFSNSSAIAKHKLTHSDERKHVCHVCKKAFKRQDHLNGHKLTHASKKPHGCRICEKSYSDARSLRRHYENAHPDEYELWRAAEEAETQLTAAVAAAAAATNVSSAPGAADAGVVTSSNGSNLAQHLVAARVTNGRNSPWLPSATSGSSGTTGAGGVTAGDGSGRVSPAISEQLKAMLMALPLEAPRVVPCAFCQRRFKNQSALNGHMRLHGGYGLNHTNSGASTSLVPANVSKAPSKPQALLHKGASTPPRLSLPASTTISRLKKHQQHQQPQAQQLTLGLGSQSINEPFRLLRDLPDTKSEGSSSSLFDWPCASVSTSSIITTAAPCVSSSAVAAPIATSRSMRPWPAHIGQQPQHQAPSNIYNAVRQDLPRPHSEMHFTEAGHSPYRELGFRKRPSFTTFGGSSPPQQFRSAQDSMWLSQHQHQSHQPLRPGRNDMEPIFSNLRLFDTMPNAFRDQGRYISRLAPPQGFPHHSSSSSDYVGSSSGSKLDSLAMFGAVATSSEQHQSAFFPSASSSYPNLHGIADRGSATAAQPHYSPITPASGGFGANSSASTAFTFPPTDALLASASTASPPMPHQQQQQPQQQQFLCPCPPSRSNAFDESNKWLSHESHSVEPMLPSTPMGQFSSPPPPPPQSMDPTSSYQHDNVQQPPRLYTPIQAQQRTQDGVENTSGGSDFSHQYLQQEQPQHSIYDHRSKTICTNTSYDSSAMRHPMTPQHSTYGIQPRAFSYCATSTQAAHSVPLMPNRERVFFPDDSDPLFLADEEPGPMNDNHPISRLLPPTQPQPVQSQPMSNQLQKLPLSQCFELSCVPMHKYTQQTASVGDKKQQQDDEGSEGIFRNPHPPTALPLKQTSSQVHLPPLSSVTSGMQSTSSPSGGTGTSKKVKKKPEPIVIPVFTHRINPSRLRSPRLSSVSSAGVGGSSNTDLHSVLSLRSGGGSSITPIVGPVIAGGVSIGSMLDSLPYTPPPMLSPNRRGSGLFSSMIARSRRPPRTATAATAVSAANLGHLRGRESISSSSSARNDRPSVLTSTNISTGANIPGTTNAPGARMEKNFLALTRRRISLGSPKSAPAFMKNAAYFSSETSLSNMCVEADDAPPTVAMRATILGADEVECPRPTKSLFFADEDDEELASMLETAAAAIKDTPITEVVESDIHPPLHGEEIADAIPTSTFPPIPHGVDTPSSSSCHCCSDASPALPHVEEMEYEEEEESEGSVVEDIGVPSNFEPKINVGEAYQAEVPEFAEGAVRDLYSEENRVYEALLWDPRNIDDSDPKTEESLTNLMNLARSPVVRNCGLNMEYTFHLLCKFQGDFEMTLRALLHESFTIFDRVYSETEYWTTEEIEKFQNSLRRPYKDFHHVSAELRACGMNKSVKACVEFYYVWKRMNTPHEVNRYRGRVHRKSVPTRSERSNLEEAPAHPPPTNEPCALPNIDNNSIDLDMPPTPDLGVEGNNASSTSYNLRRKYNDLPPAINLAYDDRELNTASVNKSSALTTTVGDIEGGFPCRQCGRCFAKVKSRNAHMKSHAASVHSKQDQ